MCHTTSVVDIRDFSIQTALNERPLYSVSGINSENI